MLCTSGRQTFLLPLSEVLPNLVDDVDRFGQLQIEPTTILVTWPNEILCCCPPTARSILGHDVNHSPVQVVEST